MAKCLEHKIYHFNQFLNFYLFILAVLGVSCGMWDLQLRHVGSYSCSMRTLSCGTHAGSSSLTRDQTGAPCVGGIESYPLDHHGVPTLTIFKCTTQ